jgi:hypothetical protein
VPIVHECAREDCSTLTMGLFCLEHELQVAAEEAALAALASEPVSAESGAEPLQAASV